MTNSLFDGSGKNDSTQAALTLKGLEVPTILYTFRNNWCACSIKLTDARGRSCSHKETQYFQLLPRAATDDVALSVSVSAPDLPWLKEEIWTKGCQSVQICRDGRHKSDEDTHLLPRGADQEFQVLKKALRPHPRILFKTSFRYPFAVLDLCKLRNVYGEFDFFCQHRDGRKGKEERMKIRIAWDPPKTTEAAPIDEELDEDDDQMTTAKPFVNKMTTETPHVKKFLYNLRQRLRLDLHKTKLRFLKPRRQSAPERKEVRRFAQLTARLERKERRLQLVLYGTQVAVTGCVILLIASIMWYYAGLKMMRKAKVPSPAAL